MDNECPLKQQLEVFAKILQELGNQLVEIGEFYLDATSEIPKLISTNERDIPLLREKITNLENRVASLEFAEDQNTLKKGD